MSTFGYKGSVGAAELNRIIKEKTGRVIDITPGVRVLRFSPELPEKMVQETIFALEEELPVEVYQV